MPGTDIIDSVVHVHRGWSSASVDMRNMWRYACSDDEGREDSRRDGEVEATKSVYDSI